MARARRHLQERAATAVVALMGPHRAGLAVPRGAQSAGLRVCTEAALSHCGSAETLHQN